LVLFAQAKMPDAGDFSQPTTMTAEQSRPEEAGLARNSISSQVSDYS
jgi:hypothetical protein